MVSQPGYMNADTAYVSRTRGMNTLSELAQNLYLKVEYITVSKYGTY